MIEQPSTSAAQSPSAFLQEAIDNGAHIYICTVSKEVGGAQQINVLYKMSAAAPGDLVAVAKSFARAADALLRKFERQAAQAPS